MESKTLEQVRRVLSDQENALKELRQKRRETQKEIEKSYVEELEILLGIKEAEEFIAKLEGKG